MTEKVSERDIALLIRIWEDPEYGCLPVEPKPLNDEMALATRIINYISALESGTRIGDKVLMNAEDFSDCRDGVMVRHVWLNGKWACIPKPPTDEQQV